MSRIVTKVLCQRNTTSTLQICSSIFQKRYIEDEKLESKKDFRNSNGTNTKVADASRVTVFKKYWIFRYIDYVKNYEQVLHKNFPKTMQFYRVFSIGTKLFYQDLKRYMQVNKKIRKEGIDSLTLEELQLQYTLPKDLIKITPVLLISAIPFTFYIIFPMALYIPHVILTSHYWSIEDKLRFMLVEHKKRLKHNRPLLRCLQRQSKKIKDPQLQKSFSHIIACLGSGTHPTVEEILSCKPLFTERPYSLKFIKRKHAKELLRVHGINKFTFRKQKLLLEHGLLIKRMDNAIRREGGAAALPYDVIRWVLSFRGVNPVNMSIESMQAWLDQWLYISSQVDEESISLLLHCPIFLAYNHETNWTLLYHSQKNER